MNNAIDPHREERRLAALLIAPAAGLIVVMALFPIAATVSEALHGHDLRLPWLGRPFVGLANFVEAAGDPRFLSAVGHTVLFALVSVPIEIALGVALALVMHRALRGRAAIRVVALLPWTVPTIVAALIWRFMFESYSTASFDWFVHPRAAWVPILRGVVSIAFGVACFMVPNTALSILLALFGAYAFLAGILAVYWALTLASEHQPWLGLLFGGILGIAAGIIAYRSPGMTAQALLYVLAAWVILRGILDLVTAYALRQVVPGEWATAVSGVLSIVVGYLLIANPQQGQTWVLWVIGIYAVLYGILMVALGNRLRSLGTAAD